MPYGPPSNDDPPRPSYEDYNVPPQEEYDKWQDDMDDWKKRNGQDDD